MRRCRKTTAMKAPATCLGSRHELIRRYRVEQMSFTRLHGAARLARRRPRVNSETRADFLRLEEGTARNQSSRLSARTTETSECTVEPVPFSRFFKALMLMPAWLATSACRRFWLSRNAFNPEPRPASCSAALAPSTCFKQLLWPSKPVPARESEELSAII